MRFLIALFVSCLVLIGCQVRDLTYSSAVILGTVSCLRQADPKGYVLVDHERMPIAVFYGHTNGDDDLKDCQIMMSANKTYQCVDIKFIAWSNCEYLQKEW